MTVELLVLQPTPFCNIDCSYCYLPHRHRVARMESATLEAAFRRLIESGRLGPSLSVVWHGGEPLVLPTDYYRTGFEAVERLRPAGTEIRHHFQTNAILVDENWCDLIAEFGVRIGVSIDGPSRLHDRHRRTRGGRGTHAAAMRGVTRLASRGIAFDGICVLTAASLDEPDAIFDFFVDAGFHSIGFNVEEIECANHRSSLAAPDSEQRFRRFFRRIVERCLDNKNAIRIREIDAVLMCLRDPDFDKHAGNSENQALRLVNVAFDGGMSTFSPELLGWDDPRYGPFVWGNVNHSQLDEILEHPGFRRVAVDIRSGVSACRRECPYFAFCRGGAPANKLSERGSAAATETMFCRLTQKAVVDVVLEALELQLEPAAHRDASKYLLVHP